MQQDRKNKTIMCHKVGIFQFQESNNSPMGFGILVCKLVAGNLVTIQREFACYVQILYPREGISDEVILLTRI